MTHALADAEQRIAPEAAEEALRLAAGATAVALGPGLGRSSAVTQFVVRLYCEIVQSMVVDADALFALAEQPPMLSTAHGPRVLTPHPGEFARLTGEPYNNTKRVDAAAQLARGEVALATENGSSRGKLIVVLKGHQTVVTDGTHISINHTGNPGMATGGSGDVLTGVITALLCQGLAPFEAARLGVHVHGLAGDLAAADLGQVSLIASDLIDYLPRAFQSLDSSS
jgi:NAD(P)H-hydrate epimerase